jgi:hypothetical protein
MFRAREYLNQESRSVVAESLFRLPLRSEIDVSQLQEIARDELAFDNV